MGSFMISAGSALSWRASFITCSRGRLTNHRLPNQSFFVSFDPQNPEPVYVAGVGGVFRSQDGGGTFQPLGLTAEQRGRFATNVNVDPSDSKTIYVNTFNGNFKSVNDGKTFTAINNGWKAAVQDHQLRQQRESGPLPDNGSRNHADKYEVIITNVYPARAFWTTRPCSPSPRPTRTETPGVQRGQMKSSSCPASNTTQC